MRYSRMACREECCDYPSSAFVCANDCKVAPLWIVLYIIEYEFRIFKFQYINSLLLTSLLEGGAELTEEMLAVFIFHNIFWWPFGDDHWCLSSKKKTSELYSKVSQNRISRPSAGGLLDFWTFRSDLLVLREKQRSEVHNLEIRNFPDFRNEQQKK